MIELAGVYAPIQTHLLECARIFRDELVSEQGFLSDLYRHVEQYHGKLIRPALLLLVAEASGGVRAEHHTLGAVVEMVHLATLVHDDVLDEADIRRRAATVNRLWGNEAAVLLGDLLFSHAYHLCAGLDSQYAARLIGRTGVTLCEGELMQDVNHENLDLTEGEYFDIIQRKTASLIGVSAELGARYAGADENVVRSMRDYGVSVGVAFQIVDDMLDLTGEESQAGKSLGRDVDKGKLTLPLIRFLSTADAAQRARAVAILRGDDPQRYRHIARLLRESDALEYATETAENHINAAVRALDALAPSEARSSLRAMAEFVIARNH